MSKFSSFKESQLLFENWRGHVNEAACVPRKRFPNQRCPDTHHSKGDLCCQTTSESLEEIEGQNILGHAEKVLGLLGGLTSEEVQEVFQHVIATIKGDTGIQ